MSPTKLVCWSLCCERLFCDSPGTHGSERRPLIKAPFSVPISQSTTALAHESDLVNNNYVSFVSFPRNEVPCFPSWDSPFTSMQIGATCVPSPRSVQIGCCDSCHSYFHPTDPNLPSATYFFQWVPPGYRPRRESAATVISISGSQNSLAKPPPPAYEQVFKLN